MEDLLWFISIDGEVSGPFLTQEVDSHISRPEGDKIYLWARGQQQWLTPKQWQLGLTTNFIKAKEKNEIKDIKEITAITKEIDYDTDPEIDLPSPSFVSTEPQKQWFVLENSNSTKSRGPLNQIELMVTLQSIDELSETMVWTDGMPEWKSLYDFHKILDDLGVPKRQCPRLEVEGFVTLHSLDENLTYTAQAQTLSEGGMGLSSIQGVTIGQLYNLQYNHSDIFVPIRAQVEIIHTEESSDNDFFCSVRFTQIEQECQAAIIEYIRKELHLEIKEAS